MRHGMSGRKLNRTSSHRKALFANLATALLKHGQIKTTLPKAKDLRRVVEPLITSARRGTLADRRLVARTIKDQEVLRKLFDEIAPRFEKRDGGYTRVLKMGFRQGDAAPMALIELTELGEEAVEAAAKPAKETKKAEAKKAAPKAEEKPAEKAEAKAEEKTEEAEKAE